MKSEQLYDFGWVADNINSNFAANSTWMSTGNDIQASKFYNETYEEAEKQKLTWFQVAI